MYRSHHTVIAAKQVSRRHHHITLLVMTRPTNPADYQQHYNAAAASFAYDHDAKVVGPIDVTLNPFRESAVMSFNIRAYKHPEKHRYEFNFTGDAARTEHDATKASRADKKTR